MSTKAFVSLWIMIVINAAGIYTVVPGYVCPSEPLISSSFFYPVGNTCYYKTDYQKDFTNAKSLCTSAGMNLVQLETEAERDWLATKIGVQHWLGMKKDSSDGKWRWLTTSDIIPSTQIRGTSGGRAFKDTPTAWTRTQDTSSYTVVCESPQGIGSESVTSTVPPAGSNTATEAPLPGTGSESVTSTVPPGTGSESVTSTVPPGTGSESVTSTVPPASSSTATDAPLPAGSNTATEAPLPAGSNTAIEVPPPGFIAGSMPPAQPSTATAPLCSGFKKINFSNVEKGYAKYYKTLDVKLSTVAECGVKCLRELRCVGVVHRPETKSCDLLQTSEHFNVCNVNGSCYMIFSNSGTY